MVFRVQVLVDWSRAFVDKNGTLYCGTTDAHKDIAAMLMKDADLYVYVVDVHSEKSPEFLANEGKHPTHNLVGFDMPNYYDEATLKRLGIEEGKTASCRLTQKLDDIVSKLPSGLIVPRHVFLQSYDAEPLNQVKAEFSFDDAEKTFGVKRLNSGEFLGGAIKYVINAKHKYDGTGRKSTEWMGHIEGVPDMEMNVFTLLQQKYGQGRDLEFNLTGVVSGICVYRTAGGLAEDFQRAKINVIADAVTHLLVPQLGLADEDTASLVIKKMCQQLGVNYITSAQYLGTNS